MADPVTSMPRALWFLLGLFVLVVCLMAPRHEGPVPDPVCTLLGWTAFYSTRTTPARALLAQDWDMIGRPSHSGETDEP